VETQPLGAERSTGRVSSEGQPVAACTSRTGYGSSVRSTLRDVSLGFYHTRIGFPDTSLEYPAIAQKRATFNRRASR
jgi:hypothetical protein